MAADVGDLIIKFSKKEYKICGLSFSDTVADLKNAVHEQTGVLPQHQKLAGFKVKVGQYDDNSQLSKMMLKPNMKLTLIGTRADVIAEIKEPPPNMPEIVDDFDISEEVISVQNREENLAKIQKRVKDYQMTLLNPFRSNKKLLVLDIDYTLFDNGSPAETANELMRPYLHEFLMSAYLDYDIGIWSATSMKWIEAKLKMLGVTNNINYKICFHLDYDAMITVHTTKYGVVEVKPLGVIWGKHPQWNETNTLIVDDIRRNFVMNPGSGLRISPFHDAHQNRSRDRVLLNLSQYLQDICDVDFTTLNHSKWKSYIKSSPRKKNKLSSDNSSSSSSQNQKTDSRLNERMGDVMDNPKIEKTKPDAVKDPEEDVRDEKKEHGAREGTETGVETTLQKALDREGSSSQ